MCLCLERPLGCLGVSIGAFEFITLNILDDASGFTNWMDGFNLWLGYLSHIWDSHVLTMGAFIWDKIRCRAIMGASTFDHTYNAQVFYSTRWGQNGALECTHLPNPHHKFFFVHPFFCICQSYSREPSRISSSHNFYELRCCVINLSLSWGTCKHVIIFYLLTLGLCWRHTVSGNSPLWNNCF